MEDVKPWRESGNHPTTSQGLPASQPCPQHPPGEGSALGKAHCPGNHFNKYKHLWLLGFFNCFYSELIFVFYPDTIQSFWKSWGGIQPEQERHLLVLCSSGTSRFSNSLKSKRSKVLPTPWRTAVLLNLPVFMQQGQNCDDLPRIFTVKQQY